jgi:O-antigen ligase
LSALRRSLLAAFAAGLAVSISLAEAALAALVLAVGLTRRTADTPPLAWPLALPVAGFAAWTLLSALGSARPLESVLAAEKLLILAAFFVVVNALPDRRAAHWFLTTLLVTVSVAALVAVVQAGACPEATPDVRGLYRIFRKCSRARGFYSIYMTLAGVLALVLVASVPWLIARGRGFGWRLPAWVVGLAALGLTYVRGAWLAVVVGVAGVVLAAWKGNRRVFALAAILGLVALLAAGLAYRSRVDDEHDDSTRDRLIMLDAGLRMARDHPWLGIGVGQVKHLYPVYAPDAPRRRTSHLHDTPLQILVERGVPGLVLWGWIFAAFFYRASRTLGRLPPEAREDRALVLGSIMAIAAFLVGGLTEYNFGDSEVLLVACSLMALPFVIERDLDRAGP